MFIYYFFFLLFLHQIYFFFPDPRKKFVRPIITDCFRIVTEVPLLKTESLKIGDKVWFLKWNNTEGLFMAKTATIKDITDITNNESAILFDGENSGYRIRGTTKDIWAENGVFNDAAGHMCLPYNFFFFRSTNHHDETTHSLAYCSLSCVVQ